MDSKISLILCGVFILCFLGCTEGSCSSTQMKCKSSSQCVNLRDICRNGQQCLDGSDEDTRICSFWKHDGRCSSGQFYCPVYGCRSNDFCSLCSGQFDAKFCELVNSGILQVASEDTALVIDEELVSLIQQAVNVTSKSSCPMFYTRIGETCLSFFSPAKIPWPEARQFCLSIGGDLLFIGEKISQEEILQYMRMSKLTSSYWIGGRYTLDTNSWSWVHDDSPMPLGSPYWTTRHTSICVPRSPPHTDPFSSPSGALPGAPCYNYVQAPKQRTAGWCAAMTYEHFYYFSDEVCQDDKSPLCVYTGKFDAKEKDSSN